MESGEPRDLFAYQSDDTTLHPFDDSGLMPPNQHGSAVAEKKSRRSGTSGGSFFFMNQTIYKMAGREDPFARVPKAMLEDERISWQAKGVLAYLVGKKDGWKMRVGDLVKKGTAGEHAVRGALKELRTLGYAQCVCVKGEKGRVAEWVWKVSDSPVFRPDGGFPHLDGPHLENHDSSKKESSKKAAVSVRSKSKEVASASVPSEAALVFDEFDSLWKPDCATKEQKLRRLRVPDDYPSEREFEHFIVHEGLCEIESKRADLYRELCHNKWHRWRSKINRWERILDWQQFVKGLDAHIEQQTGGGF